MNIDQDQAEELIRKTDKNHSGYYSYYTGEKWGQAENCHICISSSLLGIEKKADSLEHIVRTYLLSKDVQA